MRDKTFPIPRVESKSRMIKRRSRNRRRALLQDDGRFITPRPLRGFKFETVAVCLALVFSLSSCVSPDALNCNLAGDEHDRISRDPDLQWNLWMREVPQDDRLHFSQKIKRLHDPKTNDP